MNYLYNYFLIVIKEETCDDRKKLYLQFISPLIVIKILQNNVCFNTVIILKNSLRQYKQMLI